MEWYHITILIICLLILIILITAYVCFKITFYHKRKILKPDELEYPKNNFYKPFVETIIESMNKTIKMEHKCFTIKSFDNLTLHARYFECEKGAPIEILFHGYKGNSLRDLSLGVERCFAIKHNVLLIDQRAHGVSEGYILSFGVNESKDCLAWINFVINNFGADVQIILSGVSMGAGTVLLASQLDLPKNVIGVLADCGYDSAKNIIKKCIKDLRLPANLFYPFVELGALLYGHFNIRKASPIKAMEKCNIPVIFIHGDSDDFVPCEMSIKMYNVCNCRKKLVLIKGAGHGHSYIVNPKEYIEEVKNFFI